MLLALALSLIVGLALGVLGGGGSILTLPILTHALGMPTKSAIATSLAIVTATSAAALIPHALQGRVVLRTGLVFGGMGMIGAYLGGRLAAFVPDTLLLVAFTSVLVATGISMLRGARVTSRHDKEHSPTARLVHTAVHGILVGAVTGLIGAGGGFLIVPALVLLGGMQMKEAVGTSLLIITLKSFAGLLGHLSHAAVPWSIVLWLSLAAVLGGLAGGLLVKKVAQETLRNGFAWLVLAVASFTVSHDLAPLLRTFDAYQAVFVARWPFWAGGLAIAAVVLGYAFFENKQLGVSTGCAELCSLHKDPKLRASFRPRFIAGIVLGGTLSATLAGNVFGASMFDAPLGSHLVTKAGALVFAGVLLGLGARLAGGCTSGHAIVGSALGARSSLLATLLFMLSGFATTALIFALSGR